MADPSPPLFDQPTIATDPAPTQPFDCLGGDSFGDYVLLNELGRGGMGVVFRAFEPGLNRHVAVKMILAGVLPSEQDLARFRAEASTAGRL
jgi:serine/threonine protein kinase